jgi:hypothetical protein
MASGFDVNLALALAIVVAGCAVFVWHLVSTTKRVGLIISEGRVPRRYLLLGFVAGLGVLYVTRR